MRLLPLAAALLMASPSLAQSTSLVQRDGEAVVTLPDGSVRTFSVEPGTPLRLHQVGGTVILRFGEGPEATYVVAYPEGAQVDAQALFAEAETRADARRAEAEARRAERRTARPAEAARLAAAVRRAEQRGHEASAERAALRAHLEAAYEAEQHARRERLDALRADYEAQRQALEREIEAADRERAERLADRERALLQDGRP